MVSCPECAFEVPADAQFCGRCGATLVVLTPNDGPEDEGYPSPLLPGTFLESKYQILEELERGGMGVVYRGHDLTLDRTVAIKALPPHFNVDKAVVRRFKREAQAMAALDHPNVVTVYSIGQQGETHYFAMKFLEGRTVAEEMSLKRKTKGPWFDEHAVVSVLRQVAMGLAHAHQRGLIHRDIKPSNVMLGPDGHVTIMDFGIVKRQVEGAALTKAGVVFGTPEYMAPEQAQGNGPPDQTTDLYSLGIVAYEMLTGAPPFYGPTAVDVVLQHIQQAPPTLAERGVTGISAGLEALLFRLIAKNPADRFATGEALCEALDDLHLGPRLSAPRGQPSIPIATTRELSAAKSDPVPIPKPAVEINRVAIKPGTYDLSQLTRTDPDRPRVTLTDIHGRRGPSPLLLAVLAMATFGAVWMWLGRSGTTDTGPDMQRGLPSWVTNPDAGPGDGGTASPTSQATASDPVPAQLITVHLNSRPSGAQIFSADAPDVPIGTTPDIIRRPGKAVTRDLLLKKPGFHEKRVTVSFLKSKGYVIDLIPRP